MTISHKTILSFGFKPLEDKRETDSPIYVRYYDAISAMVVFESDSGEFYAIQFDNEEELAVFQIGEIAITFDEKTDTLCDKPARFKKKISLLDSINIRRVETKKHLSRGFDNFERTFILNVC